MVGLSGIKNNKTAWDSGLDTTDKNHINHQALRKGGTWREELQGMLCMVHFQLSWLEFYHSNVGHFWEAV